MAKARKRLHQYSLDELKLILEDRGLAEYYSDLVALKNMNWVGPISIDALLNNGILGLRPWPPEADGVYLITAKPWERVPGPESIALYVGSNTGKSRRFRTRIGDLLADAFGLFVEGWTGHSSGGQWIHYYCKDAGLSPKDLFIGWIDNCRCLRCAENFVFDYLEPELNRKRPSRCVTHLQTEQVVAAFATRKGQQGSLE
jgi:hypothetical protein